VSIPDKAVEAAARGIRPDLWADPDLKLAADHQKRLEFERSVVLTAARAGLEAAEPYLTGREQATQDDMDALLWRHRTAAYNGSQTACTCDRTWRSDTEHRTHLRNAILELSEVKS
jgi:hypothetical protein